MQSVDPLLGGTITCKGRCDDHGAPDPAIQDMIISPKLLGVRLIVCLEEST